MDCGLLLGQTNGLTSPDDLHGNGKVRAAGVIQGAASRVS
jgi:hypothetical protein